MIRAFPIAMTIRFRPLPVVAAALLCAGCSTPALRLTMDVPGEFKIPDASKIAILDFNTLPGDPFTGTGAADPRTCALVQRAVSAALARSGAWDVSRLDVEAAVAVFDPAVLPDRRFDAIACGRVWWQYPPEHDVLEPALFTLETKTKVTYVVPQAPAPQTSSGSSSGSFNSRVSGVNAALGSLDSAFDKLFGPSGSSSSGQASAPVAQKPSEPKVETVDLTTEKRDVLEKVGHRTREATLMLALSLYRIRVDGTISKVADTFVELDQSFSLDNGEYATQSLAFGAPDAGVSGPAAKAQEGATVLPARSSTIPSDQLAKLMLAARAAEDLGRRIAPHKAVRTVPYEFSDRKLQNLLQHRAWDAAEQYALRSVRTALGAEVAAKVGPLLAYGKPDYDVPPSPASDVEKVSGPDEAEAAAAVDRLVEKRDCAEALFALAICQEATGRPEEALFTYRYVFRIAPEAAPAEGIARCHDALGAAARIAEQRRSIRKAGARASLE